MKTMVEILSLWLLLFVMTQWGQGNGITATVRADEKVVKRTNVVLMMVDDLGYECVGAYGGTSYATPCIDNLAKEGIRFNHCYVQPLCTPTRVQLMTGMANVRNYTVFGELHPSQKTFGNLFRDAGYVTGIFGKWQLGQEVTLPSHFGFDTYRLWQHTRNSPPRYCNPGLELQGIEKDFSKGEYGPDVIQREALEFIEQNKEKPFFLYYPMILTHSPFQPPPASPDWSPIRAKNYSKTKHFKEMVECMDKHVGELLQKIDDAGLREQTLVILIGDNGTATSITSMFRGESVRGGKGKTTDAGMHSPLIVRWSGTIGAGSVCDDLVESTDFLPTICEAAGITLPTDLKIDGVSFYPQLLGQIGNPRDWIYCWYLGHRKEGLQTVCAFDKHFKLYENGDFYNVEQDSLEKNKIAPADFTLAHKKASEKLQNILDYYKDARPDWVKTRDNTSNKPTPE